MFTKFNNSTRHQKESGTYYAYASVQSCVVRLMPGTHLIQVVLHGSAAEQHAPPACQAVQRLHTIS